MKNLFLILFFSTKLFAQDSLGFKTISLDIGVNYYEIQSSIDTANTLSWSTITVIQPKRLKDSNVYAVPISTPNIYYRIAAVMTNGYIYYTSAIQYLSTLAVGISNVRLQSFTNYITIYFTSQNESNINYYEIDRSIDGGNTLSDVLHISPKGNSDYVENINRPTKQVSSCGIKLFGWCLWKNLKTVVDNSKEILYIYLVSQDGSRTLLKAISE